MKFISLFLIALCIAGSSASLSDFFKVSAMKVVQFYCAAKTGVKNELALQVRNWDFSSQDPTLKKYCFCVYSTLTIVDGKGNMDVEHAVGLLPSFTDPAKFRAAAYACKDLNGIDVFDKMYNVLKCYNIQYPKDIIAL